MLKFLRYEKYYSTPYLFSCTIHNHMLGTKILLRHDFTRGIINAYYSFTESIPASRHPPRRPCYMVNQQRGFLHSLTTTSTSQYRNSLQPIAPTLITHSRKASPRPAILHEDPAIWLISNEDSYTDLQTRTLTHPSPTHYKNSPLPHRQEGRYPNHSINISHLVEQMTEIEHS